MKLIDHHNANADPLMLGQLTADHALLGYGLTLGAHYPWVDGGVALQRRRLYPTPETIWTFCGMARPGEATIISNDGVQHDSNHAYQYRAAKFHGNGYVGEFSEPVRLDFDNAGNQILPLMPMPPIGLAAAAIDGGKIRVCFAYEAFGQGGYPTDFQVFEGATAATIDYNTPLGTIAFDNTKRRYEFTTTAFADSTPHVLVVRARNSGGVAEQNIQPTDIITAVTGGIAAAVIAQAIVRS